MRGLRDPVSGAALAPDSPHSLVDGSTRWPVLDGIPFLRAGRDEVRAGALDALDDGRAADAAALLLADNDDWWDGEPPPPDRLREIHRAADDPTTTLRDAVDALGLGRVGNYFLHRDHDPSGLAVQALTAAHPPAGRPVLDLACGAGHLLRRWAQHGERDLAGIDVVFAKLWLARRFVLPDHDVALVCADLEHIWPLPPHPGTWVAAHDVLYFLTDPAAVLALATEHAGPGGSVVAAHCHNSRHGDPQAGHARPPEDWAVLLPGARCYGEEELTAAVLEDRLPQAVPPAELDDTEAVALARDGAPGAACSPTEPRYLRPDPTAVLHPNPLYADGVRRWPDDVWGAEYGARVATYLPEQQPHGMDRDEQIRRRVVVDLPGRW